MEELFRTRLSEFEAVTKAWLEGLQKDLQSYLIRNTRIDDVLGGLLELLASSGIASSTARFTKGERVFGPYRILGLENSASDEEVKKRYRELVRILHPDASKVEGTATLFQIVVGAYEAIKQHRGWK